MKPTGRVSLRSSEFPENLSILERRRQLDDPSRRRLALCLTSSDSLRALHDVGQSFDQLPGSLAQDERLLQRMSVAAVQRFARNPMHARGHVRRRVLWLCLAGTLATLGAAASLQHGFATWRTFISSFSPPPAHQARGGRDAGMSLRHGNGAQTSASAPAHASEPPAVRVEELPLVDTPAAIPLKSAKNSTTPPEAQTSEAAGAEALFSAANTARHVGDVNGAVKLYRELENKHPRAQEALLTHALLGRIELGRQNAQGALSEYQRYLDAAPGGPLAQEALQGKARALHALGNRNEERATWRELLRRFPDSAYADAAREHLREEP